MAGFPQSPDLSLEWPVSADFLYKAYCSHRLELALSQSPIDRGISASMLLNYSPRRTSLTSAKGPVRVERYPLAIPFFSRMLAKTR
jgi:hypothetical protein